MGDGRADRGDADAEPTGSRRQPARANERPFRLVEVLAALSLASDLARGRPDGEAMRACLLATELGREVGLKGGDLAAAYWTTLLRFVGCTGTSHEYALTFGGDDIAVRRGGDLVDAARPREGIAFVTSLTRGRPPLARARLLLTTLPRAQATVRAAAAADCEVGALMARRCALDAAVERGLREMFERWDGQGSPRGLSGDAIAVASRVATVAYVGVIFASEGGPDLARAAIGRWSGRALDPAIAAAFQRRTRDLLDLTEPDDPWTAVVAAEPDPPRFIEADRLDEVAETFGEAVDLKAPFLAGHSQGVAHLAEAAGRALGVTDEGATRLRRAGHLHDLGRVGVATGTWERRDPPSRMEWERIRLHPYRTERILAVAPALADLARLAGSHHERLDGSGYHRAVPAAMLDLPARILAAADVFQALTSARPHRPAVSAAAAAATMRGLPLDRDAVGAVLDAGGVRAPRPTADWPAGLTDREVQVLRLLVEGRTEKAVASMLVVAPSTVHTHVVHLYEKAGVTTRAGAAMFAMAHDLVGRGPEIH